MPHNGMRSMHEVQPDHWVVTCRVCSTRRSKRHFSTARECHDYWREHVGSERHTRAVAYLASPEYAEVKKVNDMILAMLGGKPSSRPW